MTNILKKFKTFLKLDPVFHFILISVCIFLYFIFFGDEAMNEGDTDINITRDNILTYIQYDDRIFSKEYSELKLSKMDEDQVKRVVDNYIRDEVLYREALTMGLGNNDEVIRRRLIQKVEFMTEGVLENSSSLSDEEINKYYLDHKDKYIIEPSVTFTHVFFDKDKNGKERALELAKKELVKLNDSKVHFTKSTYYGDRFLYYVNYIDKTPDYISSHFGSDFAKNILKVSPSEKWYGPFESLYGYHLIQMSSNLAGREAKLEEVLEEVKYDTIIEKSKKNADEFIDEIIDTYNIKVDMESLLNKDTDRHYH